MCTVALLLSFHFFLLPPLTLPFLLLPPHSHPREVPQLDCTIAAVSGEHSPRQYLELVGQCLLVASGSDEEQRGELVRVLQVGTVLHFHGHWLRKFLGEGHPVDPTDQLCVIWELELAAQARLDTYGLLRNAWLQDICWDMQFKTVSMPNMGERSARHYFQCGCSNNVCPSDMD